MLAASSSSFISCRPKATTNGEEEMSASAPFHIVSHRAMATTTSHARLRRWQQQSHFMSRELIISRCFHIASHDGDSNNKVAAATTFVGSTLLVLHIVLLKSNDEQRGNSARYIASRDGDDESYCIAWQYKLAAATSFVIRQPLVHPQRVA